MKENDQTKQAAPGTDAAQSSPDAAVADGEDSVVCLTQVSDAVEADMLRDLLRQEGIPVLVRDDEGVGGYLKIYMGFSVYGESLYVRRSDYARASQLLAELAGSDAQSLAEEASLCDDAEQYEREQDALWEKAHPPEDAETCARRRRLWGMAAVVVVLLFLLFLCSR